jgi:hypothetical protein
MHAMDEREVGWLLASSGLPDERPLRRVASYSNAVWLGRTVVLLRFCRWPHLPAAADYEHLLRPADFRALPEWLAAAYPELFAGPRLRERLEVYAVLHDLRQGIQFPELPGRPQPAWSPWNRLRATLSGTSYLREWL